MSEALEKAARDELRRRLRDLDIEMLRRRQALNDAYYYPRLKTIREDCAKIGHISGARVDGVVSSWYVCAICGAEMPGSQEVHMFPDKTYEDCLKAPSDTQDNK